jgi:WD40 repeat protein
MKFPSVKPLHLLKLLSSSEPMHQNDTVNDVPSIQPSRSLLHSGSLLRCFNGCYYPNDPKFFGSFKAKSLEFSSVLGQLRETQLQIAKSERRLLYLSSHSSAVVRRNTIDEVDLTGETDCEVKDYVLASDSVRAENLVFLQEADVARQITKCNNDLVALSATLIDDEAKKKLLLSDLRNNGFLLSGLCRGYVDCGLDLFHLRSLNARSAVSFSFRQLLPSFAQMKRRLVTNYRRLYTISGHFYNPVYCSVFDLTGNFLITGADDYLVKIWDVNKGQLIKTCRGHKNYITLIVVSPDNSMFASSCTDGTIRIWRMRDGYCLLVIHHNAQVNWLKFDPYSGSLASAGDDGFAIIWDLTRLIDVDVSDSVILKRVKSLNAKNTLLMSHSELIGSSSSDPSKSFLASESRSFLSSPSTSSSSELTAAQVEELKFIIGLPHLQDCTVSSVQGDPRKVLSLDISPLGNILVTGCDDGVVRVWGRYSSVTSTKYQYNTRGPNKEMKTELRRMKGELPGYDYVKFERIANHLLLRLEGHVSPVTDIQINSLGDRILTASTLDGSVRIWSLNNDYSESVHIVLDLADEDFEKTSASGRSTVPVRMRGRGGNRNHRANNVHVMIEDKEEEVRKAQAEDSKIAEIPWNELTNDDKFYIKVYKRVRELVNRNIFALLDSYKMVPKNSRTPAYKYFHETEIYREIHVDQSEPPSVYIIISGRIRIEVETIRNKGKKPHTIACKRKGKKPMVVKVSFVCIFHFSVMFVLDFHNADLAS